MNFLFDIGHPAHVHYFKNLMWALQEKGHEVKITARDKEISLYLLNKYGFEYICTSENKSSILGKGTSLIKNDYIIYKEAKKFNPDILISFFLPFAAHVGKILNKPVLGFTDTENAILNRVLTEKFTNIVVTPLCYTHKFPENKHIRFNGYFELAYLHPNYFTPDISVLKLLGIRKNEIFVIMRFVSWGATHDIGHSGINLDMKRKAVKEFSKYAKVFITSEKELSPDLKPYQIKIPPEKMHDALAYATLLYGESATMASECAVLGTPAIYLDNAGRGYTDEQEKKYGLVFNFTESMEDQELSIGKAVELLKIPDIKREWRKKRDKMLSEKIDVTTFMVWFIENYPKSVRIMKEAPDYQYRFK